MYAETEFPFWKDPSGGRYGLALVVSFGLHLLLLWLAADYLLESKTLLMPSQPRTIRLLLSPAKSGQSDPTTQHLSHSDSRMDVDEISKQDTTEERGPDGEGESSQSARRKTTSNQRVTKQSRMLAEPHEQVSKAQIMAAAESLAQKLAAEDTSESKPAGSAIASAIAKALNRQPEPPGVSTLTDGRIRVVTRFGTTYCIKPGDHTGISGPEDDLPVSMSCK